MFDMISLCSMDIMLCSSWRSPLVHWDESISCSVDNSWSSPQGCAFPCQLRQSCFLPVAQWGLERSTVTSPSRRRGTPLHLLGRCSSVHVLIYQGTILTHLLALRAICWSSGRSEEQRLVDLPAHRVLLRRSVRVRFSCRRGIGPHQIHTQIGRCLAIWSSSLLNSRVMIPAFDHI